MEAARERAEKAREEEKKRGVKKGWKTDGEEGIVSEPWVEEKVEVAQEDGAQDGGEWEFDQGITDRLAFLNGGGAAVGGGVKLPVSDGGA